MNPKRFFLTSLAALVLISVVGCVSRWPRLVGRDHHHLAVGVLRPDRCQGRRPDFQVRSTPRAPDAMLRTGSRRAPPSAGTHTPGRASSSSRLAPPAYKSDAPACGPETCRRATGSSTAALTCTCCAMRLGGNRRLRGLDRPDGCGPASTSHSAALLTGRSGLAARPSAEPA
jgi:hypothetical protein